jgi:GntR family transcriptional repressor for pyruvate dehydrogenase complex
MSPAYRNDHQKPGLRPKRVAELIADHLRARILDGELRDGDLIPKENELLLEFPVGRSSVKEAMRILETEGLVSVRRGNVGGAVVHAPKASNAAYSLGLIFGAEQVPIAELVTAIGEIEPMCVALCTARPDRGAAVVPQLRDLQDAARAVIESPVEFTDYTRQFHEVMVRACDNRPLTIVAGALEELWSCHTASVAERADRKGRFPSLEVRATVLDEHEGLLGLIERGDVDGARDAARRHHEWTRPAQPRTRVIRYEDFNTLQPHH